jgi:hypothetical protein
MLNEMGIWVFSAFQHFFISSSLVAGGYRCYSERFVTPNEIFLDNVSTTAALRLPIIHPE